MRSTIITLVLAVVSLGQQPNTPNASLSTTSLTTSGGSITYCAAIVSGAPKQLYWLFVAPGPPVYTSWMGCQGNLDLNLTGLQLYASGCLDLSGVASHAHTFGPPGTNGIHVTIQAAVVDPWSSCTFTLTAAQEIVIP